MVFVHPYIYLSEDEGERIEVCLLIRKGESGRPYLNLVATLLRLPFGSQINIPTAMHQNPTRTKVPERSIPPHRVSVPPNIPPNPLPQNLAGT